MDSPFAPSGSSSPSSPSPSSSSGATSATMVIITVVGILAAFALLASYYAFVTKCQLLRALPAAPPAARAAAAAEERRGLGLPLIRMLPVVKFTAAGCGDAAAPRISVSECAVCLSEFEERERLRLLPNCSHAFHIDCIDTWLQGSARCPFCRSDVTLPSAARRAPSAAAADAAAPVGRPGRRDDSGSIVIEVRGERERWFSSSRHGHGAAAAATGGGRGRGNNNKVQKTESLGDEAIDTRKRGEDDEALFAAAQQPLRRSLSLDSCCDKHKHLYVSVQELLATQRQVCRSDPPPVRS
ncbi:hypothetical protein BS78_01G479300 [Paspalum vaginatum]|nr:hypothetical protein BS78_01G479300 [Paspalum vaginatum]